jgi:DivIVA domain-containing protein
VVEDEPPEEEARESELVAEDIRDVSFPSSRRGYDRRAVDAYVRRVNRVIAELEVGRSPRSAVRHALNRVAERVGGILEQARQTAEEIIGSAREEAEETIARAKAEAADLVVNASADADGTRAEATELLAGARAEAEETLVRSRAKADELVQRAREAVAALREQAEAQMRELQVDNEVVWEKRREMLDDMRALAARLEEAAGSAAARFPPPEPVDEAAEEPEPEPETEAAPEAATAAPTPDSTPAMSGAHARDGGDDSRPGNGHAVR